MHTNESKGENIRILSAIQSKKVLWPQSLMMINGGKFLCREF